MADVADGRREIRTIALALRLVRLPGSSILAAHGCDILVPNNESLSPEPEMVHDLRSIVNCFSSRALRTLRMLRRGRAKIAGLPPRAREVMRGLRIANENPCA